MLIDVMEYLDAGGPVVNSPNVDKGITTGFYKIENIKNRTLKTLQTCHIFSKEHYKHN